MDGRPNGAGFTQFGLLIPLVGDHVSLREFVDGSANSGFVTAAALGATAQINGSVTYQMA